MAESQKGTEMWPSFDVASRLYDLANTAFIASLAIGVAATVLLVWMGNVKEGYLRRDVAGASARAAEAEARSSEANAVAAKAELELAKFKAPRSLSNKQIEDVANGLSKFKGQKFQVTTFWDLPEPLALTNQIYLALLGAGWNFVKPEGRSFLLGGMAGVQVWVHPKADINIRDAAEALVGTLNAVHLHAVLKEQNPSNAVDDKIGVNVGTKP